MDRPLMSCGVEVDLARGSKEGYTNVKGLWLGRDHDRQQGKRLLPRVT